MNRLFELASPFLDTSLWDDSRKRSRTKVKSYAEEMAEEQKDSKREKAVKRRRAVKSSKKTRVDSKPGTGEIDGRPAPVAVAHATPVVPPVPASSMQRKKEERRGAPVDASRPLDPTWAQGLPVKTEPFDAAPQIAAMRTAMNGVRSEKEASKEFRTIRANLYVSRRRRKFDLKATAPCMCVPPADDAAPGCGEDCMNRLLCVECHPKLCPCGDRCSNQRLRNRQYAPSELRQAGGKGFGLYAAADVPAGTLVYEYVGEIVNEAEAKRRHAAYHSNAHMYVMALQQGEFIDATCAAGKGRFINHSCEPNCETEMWTVDNEPRIGIFTARNVAAGTEFSFDYKFERFGEGTPQQCLCGTPSCRGFIGRMAEDRRPITEKGQRRFFPGPPGKAQDPRTFVWEDVRPTCAKQGIALKHIIGLEGRAGVPPTVVAGARTAQGRRRSYLLRCWVRGRVALYDGLFVLRDGVARREARRLALGPHVREAVDARYVVRGGPPATPKEVAQGAFQRAVWKAPVRARATGALERVLQRLPLSKEQGAR